MTDEPLLNSALSISANFPLDRSGPSLLGDPGIAGSGAARELDPYSGQLSNAGCWVYLQLPNYVDDRRSIHVSR